MKRKKQGKVNSYHLKLKHYFVLGLAFFCLGVSVGLTLQNVSSTFEVVVYAETLEDLQSQKAEWQKKYDSAVKAQEKAESELKEYMKKWIRLDTQKFKDKVKTAKDKVKEYKTKLDEVNNKIANFTSGSASGTNEGVASSKSDSVSNSTGGSSASSSGGSAVSKYQGGTSQGVTSSSTDRAYVDDPRRGNTDAIKFISDDPATTALLESVTETVNSSLDGKYLLVFSSDGMLSFSNKIYHTLSDEDKRKVMELSLKTVKESQLPSKVKVKVTNFITDQDKDLATSIQALNSDTSWELSKGYALFRPFSGPLSTLFGFIAIIIFVFLSASIIFDTAYLTIGLVRSFLESDEGKPKFVTGEAWETAKEVDNSLQSGSYRDYISVYFRKRVGIFVLASLVLIYLISGQIYDIITVFLEVFEEIFTVRG